MYDSVFLGLADGEVPPCCHHQAIVAKFVAFDGWHTCRRFLGALEVSDFICGPLIMYIVGHYLKKIL